MSDVADDAAPGWDAINAEFERLYPGQVPKHYGPIIYHRLGGRDPLDGISAYKRLEPIPHWHFVTYGFSELYAKESDLLDQSGWGYELTFRLACDPAEELPPRWVFSLLQNLARYVFDSGNPFSDGHWMTLNGPIALETDTRICAIALVSDPELPAMDTVHGRLAFLQIVGLTIEEEDAIKRWNARQLLDVLLPHMPLWVTDLARPSLIEVPEVALQVEEGARRDGGSTGMLYADILDWSARKRLLGSAFIEISLGARQVADLQAMLPLRLPFGREFIVHGRVTGKSVLFLPGDADALWQDDGRLEVTLTDATMRALLEMLQSKAGEYTTPGFKGLVWRIEQSIIRDQDGEVVKVIG